MKTIYLDDETPTKSLSIRVTELERFANCPYQYKYWVWNNEDKEALEYGKLVHNYLQAMTVNKERWKRLEDRLRKTGECLRTGELMEYWRLLNSKAILPEAEVLYVEKSMTVCFVINWYNVYLSGTSDLVWSNSLKWDYKTSKVERKQEDLQYKLQWKLYPYLDEIITGEKQLWLEFLVFTKHVTPRFQQLKAEYSYEDSHSLVKYLLDKLTTCYIQDFFPVKPAWTVSCNWCPIKETCDIYKNYKLSQSKPSWQQA